MLNKLLVGAALALTLAHSSLCDDKPDPTPVDGKINWVFDYEKGKQLSLESGKPMFVVIRCEL